VHCAPYSGVRFFEKYRKKQAAHVPSCSRRIQRKPEWKGGIAVGGERELKRAPALKQGEVNFRRETSVGAKPSFNEKKKEKV